MSAKSLNNFGFEVKEQKAFSLNLLLIFEFRKYDLLFVRRDRKSLATYIVQGLILFVQADPASYQKPRDKY